MYVVAIFALALLSPLPFVSPFVYDVQNVEAQTPFGANDRDISPPIETSHDLTSSTDTQTINQDENIVNQNFIRSIVLHKLG